MSLPDDRGTTFTWVRYAEALAVPPADLDAVTAGLSALAPPPRSRGCTDDLGPRFLLVYRAGDRTIGVVIDNYGCRETRLTSDPAAVVAGDDPTLTPGVLAGAQDLLGTLKQIIESQKEPEPLTPNTATRREVDAVAGGLIRLTKIPGFGGTRVAYAEGAVVLRWKGEPPASVRARVGKQANGVTVRLQDVPYSAAELGHAAGQVYNFPQLDGSWFSSVGFDTATGVVVYSPDPAAVPVADLEEYLGVPVTVQAAGG